MQSTIKQCSRKGFWIRVAAAAIDGVCVIVLVFSFAFAAELVGFNATQSLIDIAAWIAILLVGSFDIFCAATPGKAILRVAVGRFDCTPSPVAARLLRWTTLYGAFVLYVIHDLLPNPAVAWVGGIWFTAVLIGCLASLNDGRQAWHDQVAGTAIFRRRDIYGPDATPGTGFDVSARSN